MSSRARAAVLVLLGLVASGCLIKTSKENLTEALHRYSRAVRWGRTEWMAEHVPAARRKAFMARRAEFGELQVTGCEIGEVDVKGKDRAVAMVRVDWYMVSRGRLHTSYIEQTWKRSGEQWLIIKQRLVRGAPFPLFGPMPGNQPKRELWPALS